MANRLISLRLRRSEQISQKTDFAVRHLIQFVGDFRIAQELDVSIEHDIKGWRN